MTQSRQNLLRRTLVFLCAATGFMAGADALAQGTVTLSGASGNTCTYSQMTIAPNGNVTVSCAGTTPPPPPPPPGVAIFAVSGPTSLSPNTTYSAGEFKVSRIDTNGPAEQVAFGYTIQGAGCMNTSIGPFWVSPQGSKTFNVTSTDSGSCTIVLTIQEGHQGNPASMSMAVGGSGPPPVAGCSPPPLDSVAATLSFGGSFDQRRLKSGQIAYYPVIASPDPSRSSIEFTQGEQPASPNGVTVTTEFLVSTCPGKITRTTEAAQCQYTSNNIGYNKIRIYTKPLPQYGWNDQQTIGDSGCFAPVTDGQYYVNIRWTYTSCPWANGCGFSIQWAQGAW